MHNGLLQGVGKDHYFVTLARYLINCHKLRSIGWKVPFGKFEDDVPR